MLFLKYWGCNIVNIKLRKLNLADLDVYYELNKPSRKHHDFNGPYFERESEEELLNRIETFKNALIEGTYESNCLMIANSKTDELIGQVSWYWKSKETNWMEIGIVIFNEDYWGKAIGFTALKMWINMLFTQHDEIVRIGLTTWSGNIGMIKLSQKLGLKLEAKYKKARIVNGIYYDSVSYGILRDEWELHNS